MRVGVAVANDISWRLLGLISLATAACVAAVFTVLAADVWPVAIVLALGGIVLWIVAVVLMRRHVRRQGAPAMDFERFGRTFRWW